jgi:hypothetical protein
MNIPIQKEPETQRLNRLSIATTSALPAALSNDLLEVT